MPGVAVRVMRYQYLQGERRLTPAGNGQTDDQGHYRVWGLMPGDYYVNAVARGRRRRMGGPGGPADSAAPAGGAAADGAAAEVAGGGADQDQLSTTHPRTIPACRR